MRKTQTESETEQETDAEPTRGPWEIDLELGAGDSFVWGPDGDAVAILAARPSTEEKKDNARLIAATGTAAQEAREMGYDPQKAVEALPELLKACQQNAEGMPLAQQDAQNALASAEGNGDE
jgi:hypothetical protein